MYTPFPKFPIEYILKCGVWKKFLSPPEFFIIKSKKCYMTHCEMYFLCLSDYKSINDAIAFTITKILIEKKSSRKNFSVLTEKQKVSKIMQMLKNINFHFSVEFHLK